MRRMITGKDAEIFKNVTADGTKTVVSGDLDVNGNILKNGQPIGGGSKEKVILTVKTATDSNTGTTILQDNYAANDKLAKVKVGDPISVIIKHGSTILHALNLVCVINEMPFSGMGQHFKLQGSGYCNNVDLQYVCGGYIDIGSSQDTQLYLTDTTTSNTQHPTALAVNDKVEIYF